MLSINPDHVAKCTHLVKQDYFVFTIILLALNIPPIASAFLAMNTKGLNLGDCNSVLAKWMLFNCVFCSFHLMAGAHIVNQIKNARLIKMERDLEQQSTDEDDDASIEESLETNKATTRAKFRNCICKDPINSTYFILLIIACLWLFYGMLNLFIVEADFNEGIDNCSPIVVKYTFISLSCGFVYLGLLTFGYGCFLCLLDIRKIRKNRTEI